MAEDANYFTFGYHGCKKKEEDRMTVRLTRNSKLISKSKTVNLSENA